MKYHRIIVGLPPFSCLNPHIISSHFQVCCLNTGSSNDNHTNPINIAILLFQFIIIYSNFPY